MSVHSRMKNEKIIVALLVAICLISTVAIGIPKTTAKDESSKESKVRRLGVEDPHGAPESRTDPGDVEYWALVIGISDYEGTGSDLTYCDDDAIDIYWALVNNHGWDPSHIFLLLDSYAYWDNVIYHFSMLSTLVDSNDVFLFTFSGHGTVAEDGYYGDPIDELDGWDEVLVLHDFYGLWDDDLEIILGWFDPTAKIMVVLDSCYSGGFIKSTSEFGEEILVCRSLPSSEPVEIIDSFARDLDDTVSVVLTACDDDELSYEHPALKNGVFTYYFVEGIESGFPADTNTNGRISAEESFYYASPRTIAYQTPLQNPQLYDGVTGELEFTAFSYISINVDPSGVDFGTIYEGSSGIDIITVTNSGNTAALITATLSGEAPVDFYTDNLKMFEIGPGYVNVEEWNLVLPSAYVESVSLELTIPYPCPAGIKTANLILWAEIS